MDNIEKLQVLTGEKDGVICVSYYTSPSPRD